MEALLRMLPEALRDGNTKAADVHAMIQLLQSASTAMQADDGASLAREEGQHRERASVISPMVCDALRAGRLGESEVAVDLIDLEHLRGRVGALQAALPGWQHALAVKANPSAGVVQLARELGLSAECATPVEIEHALGLGFSGRDIIFDSPCKTRAQLARAVEQGLYVNLDSFEDLSRLRELVSEAPLEPQFGVRINPEVGSGAIEGTSTATATSKFGVRLGGGGLERLVAEFQACPWLQGLHVHVGSQGCPMELLAAGARAAVDLALRIGPQVRVIDIGGGLSIDYHSGGDGPTFAAYAALLRERVPELFSGQFRVITEFGRALVCKSGVTVSRVESVKADIAITHVGANLLVRECYRPKEWTHRISVLAPDGTPRQGPFERQSIAGPLCFSGDLYGRDQWLPRIQPGDLVVVHDTGAYTRCMYSRYNSICAPGVWGYTPSSGALSPLTAAESAEDVLRFWA